MGESGQLITVLHTGGLANDYDVPLILGYFIRNIISIDLTKNQIFSVGKKSTKNGENRQKMVLLPSKMVLPPSKMVLPPSKMVLPQAMAWVQY